jgi:hypothetical protein
VITSGDGLIIIERICESVRGTLALSVTLMVKVEVPLVVGVPLITPVVGASVSPGGSADPDFRDHVYGAVPPLAISA